MHAVSLRRAVLARDAARDAAPSLFALGMWMRGLFVGASMTLAGLVSWIDSGARNTDMLTLAAAGGVLGLAALVRVRDLMRDVTQRNAA